jgi:hypothetical protein
MSIYTHFVFPRLFQREVWISRPEIDPEPLGEQGVRQFVEAPLAPDEGHVLHPPEVRPGGALGNSKGCGDGGNPAGTGGQKKAHLLQGRVSARAGHGGPPFQFQVEPGQGILRRQLPIEGGKGAIARRLLEGGKDAGLIESLAKRGGMSRESALEDHGPRIRGPADLPHGISLPAQARPRQKPVGVPKDTPD